MTYDRFAQREPAMDRRAFVAASTAAAVGLSLAGCAPSVEKMAETGDAPSEPQEQSGCGQRSPACSRAAAAA